jgi:hypothetical protein
MRHERHAHAVRSSHRTSGVGADEDVMAIYFDFAEASQSNRREDRGAWQVKRMLPVTGVWAITNACVVRRDDMKKSEPSGEGCGVDACGARSRRRARRAAKRAWGAASER